MLIQNPLKNSITIRESIFILKPREAVWEFTQDFSKRSLWDSSVLEAVVLQSSPSKTVRLKIKGSTEMIFVYKLNDKPNKTTIAVTKIKSPVLHGGGGSWQYEETGGGTLWTQTNTLVFRNSLFLPMLIHIYKWIFSVNTKRSMHKAKKILEADY